MILRISQRTAGNAGISFKHFLKCQSSRRGVSSRDIRSAFLEHFKKDGHEITRSSSVFPPSDVGGRGALHFVNAGMNEYKDIFLGTEKPAFDRVANIQKCIRMNDFNVVGTDGTHHTFFEMMGNWHFNGSTANAEAAIKSAWELLTKVYSLSPERLYVTYFGGCEKAGIPEDTATRDIWLSLGLEKSRVLPFGMKDNFWSMGTSGPCGPSTEIHYDHNPGSSSNRASLVNADSPELVEIWNLVFMQYEKSAGDSSLAKLDRLHVDTGMGLERLTALLNGSTSNYETDLFRPIIETVQHSAGEGVKPYSGSYQEGVNNVDAAYRILADHLRMISVCVSDGLLPDTSLRLRHVFRRAFRVNRDFFNDEPRILLDGALKASEILSPVYPEMASNFEKLENVFGHERELFLEQENHGKALLPKLLEMCPDAKYVDLLDVPAIHKATAYLRKNHDFKSLAELDGPLAYKVYRSTGLSSDQMDTFASINNLEFHPQKFDEAMDAQRKKSKLRLSLRDMKDKVKDIPPTDDEAKYTYFKENTSYRYVLGSGKVLALFKGVNCDERVESLKQGESGVVLLDKTYFYAEAGGQAGDNGALKNRVKQKLDRTQAEKETKEDKQAVDSFAVTTAQYLGGNEHVAHVGSVESGEIKVGDVLRNEINAKDRLSCMQNHTGAHLLNAVLRSALPYCSQRAMSVTPGGFKFEVGVYNSVVDSNVVLEIERAVNMAIEADEPIQRVQMSRAEAEASDAVIRLPGERYPPTVTVVQFPSGVGEACCGTHVLNTADVEAFSIMSVSSPRGGVKVFNCVTGARAVSARYLSTQLIEDTFDVSAEYDKLQHQIKEGEIEKDDTESITEIARTWIKKISSVIATLDRSFNSVPLNVAKELNPIARSLYNDIVELNFNEFYLESQITQSKTRSQGKYVICAVANNKLKNDLTGFAKRKKPHSARPFFLLVSNKHVIRTAAFVTKGQQTESFDSEKWLSKVFEIIAPKYRSEMPEFDFNATKPFKFDDKYFMLVIDKTSKLHNEKFYLRLVEDLKHAAEEVARTETEKIPVKAGKGRKSL